MVMLRPNPEPQNHATANRSGGERSAQDLNRSAATRGEALFRGVVRTGDSTDTFETLLRFTIRTFATPTAEASPPAADHSNRDADADHDAGGDPWAFIRDTGHDHRSGDHSGLTSVPIPTAHGNRLNLLLSWGGWQNESWVDRLPALLEPMGVHYLRVRTAREAERAIRTNPVHIAVVDLGLPLDSTPTTPAPSEEAGPRVLELLRRLESPPPTVVVQRPRSARDASRHMSHALRCDAFAVVDRAAADVELMLKVLQRCLQRFYHGRWPGI